MNHVRGDHESQQSVLTTNSYASSFFDPPLLVDTFVMDHENSSFVGQIDINISDISGNKSSARSKSLVKDKNVRVSDGAPRVSTAKDDESTFHSTNQHLFNSNYTNGDAF